MSVVYGGVSGPDVPGNQWFQQGNGVPGLFEAGDHFGYALAHGDFDADGYSDLAIGSPGERIGGLDETGNVTIVYGSAGGLTSVGAKVYSQDTQGVIETNEEGDRFGASLATGDFNGDGFADLLIGVPGEKTGGKTDAGRAHVLYGSPSGITTDGDENWHQNSQGTKDSAQVGDDFGYAVASGDFNNDGNWDAAIGSPGEGLGGDADAGTVFILYGSLLGITAVDSESWNQDRNGIKGIAEKNDRYAAALASGDFNGDGFHDLAVGVPGEAIAGVKGTGLVNPILGGPIGLTAVGDKIWHQGSGPMIGDNEQNDGFGSALAAGDFNNDGYDDLAIGKPKKNVPGFDNAGEIAVMYGTANALKPKNNQAWNRETPGVNGVAKTGANFGSALVAFDGNNDGYYDIAIGIPGQKVAGNKRAGAVLYMKGSNTGITGSGDREFNQNKSGMLDAPGKDDEFGAVL